MKPFSKTYTPAATTATGFMTGATGAGPFTTTTTTSADGLAHNITVASTVDLTAIIGTFTGTDADGNTQTEAITFANNNTATGAKFFMTVTSFTVNSTLGANTINVGYNGISITPTLPMNHFADNFAVALNVWITGTISVTVQHTFDAIYAAFPSTLHWMPHATLAAITASTDSNYAFPVRACRLKINSVTAGATVEFNVIQSS